MICTDDAAWHATLEGLGLIDLMTRQRLADEFEPYVFVRSESVQTYVLYGRARELSEIGQFLSHIDRPFNEGAWRLHVGISFIEFFNMTDDRNRDQAIGVRREGFYLPTERYIRLGEKIVRNCGQQTSIRAVYNIYPQAGDDFSFYLVVDDGFGFTSDYEYSSNVLTPVGIPAAQ
ncbi:hypothetical protein OAS86_06130 [Gammaproteobacteria bacterium]|nr:hypothetical protein [Gammaproteobacteria bacterium]